MCCVVVAGALACITCRFSVICVENRSYLSNYIKHKNRNLFSYFNYLLDQFNRLLHRIQSHSFLFIFWFLTFFFFLISFLFFEHVCVSCVYAEKKFKIKETALFAYSTEIRTANGIFVKYDVPLWFRYQKWVNFVIFTTIANIMHTMKSVYGHQRRRNRREKNLVSWKIWFWFIYAYGHLNWGQRIRKQWANTLISL